MLNRIFRILGFFLGAVVMPFGILLMVLDHALINAAVAVCWLRYTFFIEAGKVMAMDPAHINFLLEQRANLYDN